MFEFLIRLFFVAFEILFGRIAPAVIPLLGVYGVFLGLRDLSTYFRYIRGLDENPLDEIRHHDQLQEMSGRVSPREETLTAPFSRSESVAYEYKIREVNQNGATVSLDSGTVTVPFEISDRNDNAVLVRPEGADLRFGKTSDYRVSKFDEVPEPVRAFVESGVPEEKASRELDLEADDVSLSNSFDRDFSELRIEPGEKVYVYGEPMTDEDAEFDSILEVGDGDETPFIITHGYDGPGGRVIVKSGVSKIASGILVIVSFFWFFGSPIEFLEYLFSPPIW
ncbi:hypothetical protein [Halorussus aquaticus]|uniref:RING-type E3 ubiquitin transferase n=1 Tax=Halorussus aquaticus TaxID=2953748 RepID=A0ABD5Q5Y3_9EURY|nr:hypothetical protein [Halorussus aquaticus]